MSEDSNDENNTSERNAQTQLVQIISNIIKKIRGEEDSIIDNAK